MSINGSASFPPPPPPPAPPAPTGLSATPGDASVELSWLASSGATTYNIKRATVTGGPYTTINGVTGSPFSDAGLTNATEYFYVVSAVNAGGESANSSEVNATPAAPAVSFPLASSGLALPGVTVTVADVSDLNQGNNMQVSTIDFTGITNTTQVGAYLSNQAGATFVGLTDLYNALSQATSGGWNFSNDGLTDISAFVSNFAYGLTYLVLDANPVNGSLGATVQPSNNSISIQGCGLTSCPTISINDTGGSIYLDGNNFTSVDFSNQAQTPSFGFQISFSNCPVATITPGDGTTTGFVYFGGGNMSFSGCALTNAGENALLASMVAMETASPGNNATLDISGGTNASPDGTGLAYIATLTGAGWTIYNN